jgi:4,5-dihydroxyphthalate decarboxylase
MQLPISVAIGDYDRTQDLLSGKIAIDGAAPTYLALEPEEIFHRSFRHQEFDVCEISLSSYVLQVSKEATPFVGLPIFLSRMFRHNGIYVRTGNGIRVPADLKGKRVGCPEWQLTAGVWIRGFLEDQFGVHWSEIEWVRGGIEQPGRPEKLAFTPPAGLRLVDAPAGRSLTELLLAGEIDALISPRRPSAYVKGHPDVTWLFEDPQEAALANYRETLVFPVMHLLGLRRELADRHPWLPSSLMKAFTLAKDRAVERLEDTAASKVTLPFLEEYTKRSRQILGQDFWPYGVQPNVRTLERFLDHHHNQGLSSRRVALEELFHPATTEMFKI